MPATDYRFVVYATPYTKEADAHEWKILAETQYHRSGQGGLGHVKTSSNYAPLFHPTELAMRAGYDTILWLDASDGQTIQECNAMNIFFVVKGHLITPQLEGTILPGITRRSVIELARDVFNSPVQETRISIDDLRQWVKQGDLDDMFITASAAGLCRLAYIDYLGERLQNRRTSDLFERITSSFDKLKQGQDEWGYLYVVPEHEKV